MLSFHLLVLHAGLYCRFSNIESVSRSRRRPTGGDDGETETETGEGADSTGLLPLRVQTASQQHRACQDRRRFIRRRSQSFLESERTEGCENVGGRRSSVGHLVREVRLHELLLNQ